MKRLRYLVLLLIAAAVFVRSGQGCAFSDDDDVPSHADPDLPYSAFLNGRLGVVSGDLRIRHLVVAYNVLSGRGLTPGERKAAVDVDRFYNYGGGEGEELASLSYWAGPQQLRRGMQAWFASAPNTPAGTEHTVPGQSFPEFFVNCLDDAYEHASDTLDDLRKRFGKPVAANADPAAGDTAEIKEWIGGQVAVFSNCSDVPPRPDFTGGAVQQAPAAPAVMPQPVSASAPLWLRQARAYQIAAADFYALRYDKALAEFNAIAADKGSPYALLSRYVAARVLIRQAVVPYKMEDPPVQVLHRLAEARDALNAILRDPSMAEYHAPAQHLLDYVMVRLDPAAQAEELARRLAGPKPRGPQDAIDMDYRQNIIDLTYAYNSLPSYSPATAVTAKAVEHPQSPLLRWINDLDGEVNPYIGGTVKALFDRDPSAQRVDALNAWRSTRQPQWLTAALAAAQPGHGGVKEMIAAARAVPAGSPAYATVTYHRLRLESAAKGSYGEIAALMPEIERTQSRSTINLFAALQSSVAPTLDLFLGTATRITPVSIQAEPGEGQPTRADNPYSPPSVTLCGVDIREANARHLGLDTYLIFNQRMPLERLREAALSGVLPGNVRFAVAHMAWTRAVLLDRPEIARSLSPYLAGCQPAFKTWLDQYDAARTQDERHVLGLLATMRFASTEPTVRAGEERDFAAYSLGRDNWWCDETGSGDATPGAAQPPQLFSQPIVPRDGPAGAEPDPAFLTAADRAAADREVAALEKIGSASDYFAREALAWVKAHPNDPHDADVLGFAMRVVRNACRSKDTAELNHQLFDMLHSRFPKSEWATRYTTWE